MGPERSFGELCYSYMKPPELKGSLASNLISITRASLTSIHGLTVRSSQGLDYLTPLR